MWAAHRGHVDAVKTLTERGADMNMLDEPLTMLSNRTTPKCVRYLRSMEPSRLAQAHRY